MRRNAIALLLGLCACSGESRDTTSSTAVSRAVAPADARPDASARYLLHFAGAPVGLAELSLRRRAGGYQFQRRDSLSVRRDGQRVDSTTSLTIETDGHFAARSVRVVSKIGAWVRVSRAERDAAGWLVIGTDEARSRRPSLELADLALTGAIAESGPMLLASADFAAVATRRTATEAGLAVEFERDSMGSTRLEFTMGRDGLPTHWSSDSGESATRLRGIPPTIEPVELLDLAALPNRGRRSKTLRVRDAGRSPPPSIAGQTVRTEGDDWRIEFRRPVAAIPVELAQLVDAVSSGIDDDMALPGLGAKEALRMGRGDCSGHAAALSHLARARGYPTQLATGYRRRGRQWLRHRWVLAEVDGVWVSLDPSFGEAVPTPGRLLLLAAHESDAVALADLVAFSGMASATASFE